MLFLLTMANLLFFKKVLPFSKGTFHFLETFHPFKKASPL
jgi:hypothetical protein